MISPTVRAVTAICLLTPLSLLAQEQQENRIESAETNKPYEVVITGKPTRARLRTLIEEVEEDFFNKFNELNHDNAYDMYCFEYTPTMSHIKKRACEPLFMIRQRAENGANLAFSLGGGGAFGWWDQGGIGNVYLESPEEMRKNMSRHYEILVEKLEDLTATDSELGEIANVMQQLKNRLENY